MKRALIISPHSDDAILCCGHILLGDDYEATVLTVECNPRRLAEDRKLCEFIERPHATPTLPDFIDDLYPEYFRTKGRTAVLTREDVRAFYETRLSIPLDTLRRELRSAVADYGHDGYTVFGPMGVGHPFHLLINEMIADLCDYYYREFPHSYKRRAQTQFADETQSLKRAWVCADPDVHEVKMALAQKFYRSQSGFFFYEQGSIKKQYPEEIYELPNLRHK